MTARHRLGYFRQISIALSTLATWPASAQGTLDDAPQAAAAKHYDQGLAAYDDKRFGEALKNFEIAYGLTKDFRVLYDIGVVDSDLTRPVEAADAFEKYLNDGGDRIEADQRKRVATAIEAQKAQIGSLSVRTVPEHAQTRVDGVMVGDTPLEPPLRVAQGSHRVAVTRDGYQNETRELEVAGRSNTILDITLNRVADGTRDDGHAEHAEPNREIDLATVSKAVSAPPPSRHLAQAKVLVIAGGALMAAGGGAWLVAGEKFESLVSDCAKGCTGSRYASGGNDVKTWDRVADVGLIAGGALAIGGVTLYFASRHGQSRRSKPPVTVAIDVVARTIGFEGYLP